MVFHEPPRRQGVHGGVRLHLSGVDEQLLAPHQPGLEALLNDPLEEATEDLQPVAVPDPGEAGVLGQRFVEVVTEVPTQREAIGDYAHELTLRPEVLKLVHAHWSVGVSNQEAFVS